MSDELAAQDASAEAPVTSEIEKVKAQYEDRLKGFQRLVAERDSSLAAIQSRLEEQELSSLSPDERYVAREKKLTEENNRLRAQLELDSLKKDYGAEYELYSGLIEKKTAKEQLDFAREWVTRLAPKAEAPDAGANVPDVDMNNPMRTAPEGIRLSDGSLMTEEIADRLLRATKTLR